MRQNEANMDIRQRAEKARVPLWKLASAAGIASTTLTVWLREDLPKMDPRRIRLLSALQELEQERTGGKDGETR